jgi:hypothetical protein
MTKRHTYAAFRDRPWILYDDQADPFQMHNLVGEPVATPVLADMQRLLAEWLRRLDDPFDTSEDVAEKYLPGSNKGIYPAYENKVIREGKANRKKVI